MIFHLRGCTADNSKLFRSMALEIVQGCGCQAVGDGRSLFGDSWRRQTVSGTANPDQSPLNQNRSRWVSLHSRESVNAIPNWDGLNPNGTNAKPDRGGGRIRRRRHKWYLYVTVLSPILSQVSSVTNNSSSLAFIVDLHSTKGLSAAV